MTQIEDLKSLEVRVKLGMSDLSLKLEELFVNK